MGSRWSCRRTHLTTTMMMMTMTMTMTKTMTWRPGLASVRIRGWARGRQASFQVGWRHHRSGPGCRGPGPRSGGGPRGYLTPWLR
jgi:hypothetical protein